MTLPPDWTGLCVAIVVLTGCAGLVLLVACVTRTVVTFFRFLARAEEAFQKISPNPVPKTPVKPKVPEEAPVTYEGFCSCNRRIRIPEGLAIEKVIIKDGEHLKEVQCPACPKKLLLPVKKPGE